MDGSSALTLIILTVDWMFADRPEDDVRERASAAPNLANAPHDGPDEPLLLHYKAENGMAPTSPQCCISSLAMTYTSGQIASSCPSIEAFTCMHCRACVNLHASI